MRKGVPTVESAQAGVIAMARAQGRLGRRKPCHGNPERRTGDVIEPRRLAEGDGFGVTAMLAADRDGDAGLVCAGAVGTEKRGSVAAVGVCPVWCVRA